jgi:hypothetical protein
MQSDHIEQLLASSWTSDPRRACSKVRTVCLLVDTVVDMVLDLLELVSWSLLIVWMLPGP